MADQPLRVVTICGSLRKGSYNRALMKALPALAPTNMTLTEAPPFDKVPFYNADDQNASGFPDSVKTFAEAIRAADGVIIVSPEYNWTVPGALKNVLDWVSRMPDHPFKEKPVLIQSASGGPMGGSRMQYHMRQILTYLSAFTFGTPEVLVTFAAQKFDEKTLELKDEPTRKIIGQQLAAFATFITRVRM